MCFFSGGGGGGREQLRVFWVCLEEHIAGRCLHGLQAMYM